MIDFLAEFTKVVAGLEKAGLDYAICGGWIAPTSNAWRSSPLVTARIRKAATPNKHDRVTEPTVT